MAQIKKLSVATVYGRIDVKKVLTSDKPISVMRVAGQAVGTKQGDSQYGEWTALVGRFVAVNPETGEVSEASQLFLPEVALLPIQVALAQEGAKMVDFAIELQVRPAQNTKPGGSPYEYTFESLKPVEESDPMAQFRALLIGESTTPKLAAPTGAVNPDQPGDDAIPEVTDGSGAGGKFKPRAAAKSK